MGLIDRIFGSTRAPDMGPLYAAVVARARAPEWYLEGQVADSMDGRFEVLALIMALTLIRIEHDGQEGALPSVRLAERFVTDMDGQMRETGFGDLVVGKQVSKAMGALGGRLGAYRNGFDEAALVRNLWRGEHPGPAAIAKVRALIEETEASLNAASLAELVAGSGL